MPYTHFAKDKPVIADTGAAVIDATRTNLMALRDSIIAGTMRGWSISQSGGTPEEPTSIVYSNGVERVQLGVAWGASGGALGNPITVVYWYSNNSGTSFDSMGTMTLTYDANGNMTGSTWS